MKIYDVLIIGAGAAGLFLAANLRGKSVAILEKNGSAGKKILASGGGRCNITNREISARNYRFESRAGEDLLCGALNGLGYEDVLRFFSKLKFSEQKNAQFFCDEGSKAVLGALLRRARASGAEIFCGREVASARKISRESTDESNVGDGEIFEILSANGEKFYSRAVVVACGASSYKALGGSDTALKIARGFGLEFTPFSPALTGWTAQKEEFWFKQLSGVSVRARVRLDGRNFAAGADALEFEGDTLFTHRGISGPAILNASLFWKKGAAQINFAPKFWDEAMRARAQDKSGQSAAETLSEAEIAAISNALTRGKKQLSSMVGLPRRFTLAFLSSQGLCDKAYGSYSASEREKILRIFNYRFAPAGTFGFERAEVCAGGVSAQELDENFGVKSVRGLFFVGEATEITGMLGGYNLHFAFASALRAAKFLSKER